MGLDISFRLLPAIQAGLETRIVVESGLDNYGDEVVPERVIQLMHLPGEENWRELFTYTGKESRVVRCSVNANKWGSFYTPLTEFLTKHSIEWIET